jgi:Hypervirulence associated proteins TUDOR domain
VRRHRTAPGCEAYATASGSPVCMSDEFKKGDKVVWSSHGQDDTPGVVERKITSNTEAAGRKVKASAEEPQYLVRSEKGGGEAVHKPSALKRR